MILPEFRILLLNTTSAGSTISVISKQNVLLKFMAIKCYSTKTSSLAVARAWKKSPHKKEISLTRLLEQLGTSSHKSFQVTCVQNFSSSSLRTDAAGANKPPTSSSKAVSKSKGTNEGAVTLSLGEKAKENAKTATYGGVILFGVGVTLVMGYLIVSELLSPESPNNIYTKSFKLCKANQEVQDILGSPLKCYGEETRKGWRRHVAHQQYLYGDTKILRMQFYIEGKFNKGTVHVEKKSNASGKYEYSYLLVDVDGYPSKRIAIDT